MKGKDDAEKTMRYGELEDMLWHACYREYYDEAYAPYWNEEEGKRDAKGAAMALMEASMMKIANMVGGWIRVGFVQGNFNADNCLIGGRTMDYGPFGFVDVYVGALSLLLMVNIFVFISDIPFCCPSFYPKQSTHYQQNGQDLGNTLVL